MSFSNGSGGTLALPSPTHAHHMDVTSAVRSLRHSISRSPSKFLSRTGTSQSVEGSPRPPTSRRHTITPQRSNSAPLNAQTAPATVSHPAALSQPFVFTPLRPGAKLSLRSVKSAKSLSPSRALTRSRASPRSPLKRALNNTSDLGNSASVTQPSGLGAGKENTADQKASPTPTPPTSAARESRHSLHLDVTGSASQYSFLKSPNASGDLCMTPATGTLKRSDATMNLDHSHHGSPVAKRRSLHGISTFDAAPDFNVWQRRSSLDASPNFDILEDSQSEYELSGAAAGRGRSEPAEMPQACVLGSTQAPNLPKRSSSLRKSTLQQRHGDKLSWGRRSGERQLAQLTCEAPPNARARPRLSTDQFLPPALSRDSPFSMGNPLPNASIHVAHGATNQPHPLSKTLTTSSSGNRLMEETAIRKSQKPMGDKDKTHPFSQSLPLNAVRPTARPLEEHTKAATTPTQPANLWMGAFNSTGLVSKVNRNFDEEAETRMAPPDTPCKRHANPFATFPPPAVSAMKRRGNNRNSFGGMPSTPLGRPYSRGLESLGRPAKGLSIFQRASGAQHSRRSSLLGLEGDERFLFGDGGDLCVDGDGPTTPSKGSLAPSLSNLSEQSLESPSAQRTFVFPLSSAAKTSRRREPSSSPMHGQRTPRTPQENLLPLDTSRLSISQAADGQVERCAPPPVTPTAGRDFRSSTGIFATPVNARMSNPDPDASLHERFDKVEQVGKGEFSTVYRVTKTELRYALAVGEDSSLSCSPAKNQVYAVKKSRHPYLGQRDRQIKFREVQALRAMRNSEHIVQYVDSWEDDDHLYIQTEFCEEGSLDKFLGNVGRGGRLDDFRIFKILQDLCLGLKEIHEAGFMHLDIKPANILINFEGALKIGDFGLAQENWPPRKIDMEGDREYMAPEMLKGLVDKGADIFSLGLMVLEMAANVVLPDNGPSWIALRSGDLSEVPSLTWTPSIEAQQDVLNADTREETGVFGPAEASKDHGPPRFMIEAWHASSLDSIVRWMTMERSEDRPLAEQVLSLEGVRWVGERRNAPATVYEGSWGPTDRFAAAVPMASSVSIAEDSDTEMVDV
ncbi:hypothetical protein CDD81_6427 [Ophiocordyceps australis]|uniref:Protein kinase domain-containing protein n=1 Tax=Ophiocordyceps australis TaxID=1399860 RepID=A0A2C5Y6X9_9HYPO|nr:hypothetical protein CDD81_6427 [Ophiocordyceps australis]